MTSNRRPLTKIGVVSILIGLMANAFAASVASSHLAEPVGASIRPMTDPAVILFATLLGACGAALASIPARERPTRWIGVAGLALGLAPLPLGLVLVRIVIRLRHLTLLP